MVQALANAQERVEAIIARFFHEHPDQRAAWEQKAPYMKDRTGSANNAGELA